MEMKKINSGKLQVQLGGGMGGCGCADDSTHSSDINEYCEVQLDIDKMTAATAVALISE